MTDPDSSAGQRPVTHISTLWAWLFVALLAVALAVGIVGRVFSTAVVLDLVSFWPFLVVIFLVAAAVIPRSRGRWLGSVVPLLLIGWLVTAIVLHLSGWDQLPSSAARLDGPLHVGAAQLTIDVPGIVTVEGAAAQPESYQVIPRRAGGTVGAPEALERQEGTALTVGLRPTDTSAWFRSEGWALSLDERIVWTLDIMAEQFTIDAGALDVIAIVATGDGTVISPSGSENPVDVELRGNVTVVVSPDSIVNVIGDAAVPVGYIATEEGFVSGDGAPDIVVRVISGTVTIQGENA